MEDIKNLISRMEKVACATVNQRKAALAEIKSKTDRINDLIKLVNAAEKNGIAMKQYRNNKNYETPLSVACDYLIYKNPDYNGTMSDDEKYYVDRHGDVYYSSGYMRLTEKGADFESIFMIKEGLPENEELNKRVLGRLRGISFAFDRLEKEIFGYVENYIKEREEN